MGSKNLSCASTAGLAFVQGALLITAPWWLTGPAIKANELLYAEEFDRSGFAPAWCKLWLHVGSSSLLAEFILLSLGLAFITASVLIVRRLLLPGKAFFVAVAASAVLSVSATAMLLPLHQAIAHSSSSWPPDAPAFSMAESLAIGFKVSLLNIAASILLGKAAIGSRHRFNSP